MKYTVKKCYKGIIDLRDYNVKKCIAAKQNYIITYQDEQMTLSPEDLTTKIVQKQPVNSIIDGSSYELWSYKWNPDE